MTWIQTFSGKAFDLLTPRSEDVEIEDIAHALARICRYNGHTRTHYSVAEHSVIVSQIVPGTLAREGLLHDAAEAYVGDATSPLKIAMRALSDGAPSAFDDVETAVRQAVFKRFGVVDTDSPHVREADVAAFVAEAGIFFPQRARDWCLPSVSVKGVPRIYGMPFDQAKACFLERAAELGIA